MRRLTLTALVLLAVGGGLLLLQVGPAGAGRSSKFVGVWVWDPEAKTTLARQKREFETAQARALPLGIETLLAGGELQLGPEPPKQGLMVLILLPNGEAGARPEPPAFIGTATGRWTEKDDTVVVTLTESLGEPFPEPVVLRGRLRDGRLSLEATLLEGVKETWDLVRFADDSDCHCSEGTSAAPTWCWRHDRGFLSTGETDCWRCVFSAMRREPCLTCCRKHTRQGRMALLRGNRAKAVQELAQALSTGADEPNLRFLLGQAATAKRRTTWKVPVAADDVKIVGGLVSLRTQDPDQLQFLDGATGRTLLAINEPGDDPIWAVAPDGRYVARVEGNRILLHELGSDAKPRVLALKGLTFRALAFAARAPSLVAFAAEGKVVAWDVSGEQRWSCDVEAGEAFGIASDPSGLRAAVISMGDDMDLVVCGGKTPNPPIVFKDVAAARCVFSPLDADTLAYTRWLGAGNILSLSHPAKRIRLPDHGSAGLEPKGGWFAWGGKRFVYMDHFNVQVVDPRPVGPRKPPVPDATPESAARLLASLHGQRCPGACDPRSPDGMRFATVGDDGTVHVWAADTLALLARFPTEAGKVRALGFTPDGDHLVACHQDGKVFVFRVTKDMRSAEELVASRKGR